MSNQIVIADGSRGYSKFLDSPRYSALGYFGFKIGGVGGSARIKNCKITLVSNNEVFEFGVNTNWDIIRYFPVHDIIIDSNGIGRSGSGNLGNGWISDVCGFYLDIPPEKLLSETDIVVDYEYTSPSLNKHGVGFWNQVNTVNNFGLENWIGTWVNDPLAYLPTTVSLPKTTITPQSSVSFGTFYSRRIVIRSNP
jgi:hypothetical protein